MVRELTEREGQILVRLCQRVPIKIIAADLGVSRTRINQHIKTLKELWGVNGLSELVVAYRKSEQYVDPCTISAPADATESACKKDTCANRQVEMTGNSAHLANRDDAGVLQFSDVQHFQIEAPWVGLQAPKVVPGGLNGKHALVVRFATMVGMTIGLAIAIVVSMAAARSVGEVIDHIAAIPEDKTDAG